MKKTIITIVLLTLCLVSGIAYSIYIKPSNTESINTSSNSITPSITPNLPEKKQPTIYEIRGSYPNMNAAAKKSLNKWKAEVTEEVKKNPETVFLNGQPTDKLVALTFDDGPDGNITPKILDILKNNNVHGNFFFIGDNVKNYPQVVKRAYTEGNLVLNHSLDHPEFYNKDINFINSELGKTDDYIKQIIGVSPALVRPPYGIVTDNLLKIAKERGYKLIIWSTDTYDWAKKDKNSIAKNVLDNVRPGEIILMHSNGDKFATSQALPEIIKGLQEKGYNIVTLDKLLNTNAYK
ncbi:MAG: polysaccharide deacetylase family protein [Bacillota bacterium]|nr:polysaccharide deacetylase family protein [Bacillota bacterium]